MQWVTHEVWLPGRRAIAFVDWPRGMRLIDIETGNAEWLHRFPAWHAAPDAAGKRFVCDTNFPDRGLHIISARRRGRIPLRQRGDLGRRALGGPFPYNDGPGRGRSAPAHASASALLAGRRARRVHLGPHRHSQIYEVELGGARA